MLKKRFFFVGVLAVLAVFALGCEAEPVPEEVPEEDPEEVAEPEYPMGHVDQPLAVDGSVDGYPADPLELAGATIHLAHDDESIFVHLEAEVEGWVSVGFNSSGGGMDGANMILGYFDENGEPTYRDDVARGRSHAEAGVAAVDQFFFDRSEGLTTFEFSYPLDFPSDEGYNLEGIVSGGTYSLIVGLHNSSDNVDTTHTSRGMVDFQVQPNQSRN